MSKNVDIDRCPVPLSSLGTENLFFTSGNIALNLNRMLRVRYLVRENSVCSENSTVWKSVLKSSFQSEKFSERAEILLFTTENVALQWNRTSRLNDL